MHTLTLTTEEANAVLSALGHFPFNQVAPLIGNIRGQLVAQPDPQPEPAQEQNAQEQANG